MSDELIQVYLNDKSATISTSIQTVGATVIQSPRGATEPVLFYAKQSKRILDYFGIPDSGNEAVDDILNFNSKYPIWVSSPSTGGKYGGVLVTKTGSVPFISGKASKQLTFAEVDAVESVVQVPNGVLTNFNKTIHVPTLYVPQSIDILVDGVSINVVASSAEPEVLTTVPDVGGGTFTKATGAFDFTFDAAPLAGTTIQVNYKANYSTTAYFAIFNKNKQIDDLKAKVSLDDDDNFIVEVSKKAYDSTIYSTVSGYPLTGSLDKLKKNGYQVPMYLPTITKDSDIIEIVVNADLAVSTMIADVTPVALVGGSRGLLDGPALTAGWAYFQNAQKYKASIIFDTTANAVVPPLFQTLRSAYQKYSHFICHLTNVSYSDAITASAAIMTDNRGISFYWGYGKILNAYTNELNASSLMGRVALRFADMYDVFNGLAPAWYNENGVHGGQLGAGIVEMFYDADDMAQELLYAARINPIIMHPSFGVTITRERTSQSLLSDYSSIGHSRLADYYINNILTQVAPYQLYRLNDENHRTIVKAKTEAIISPTIASPYNLLRDFIVKCDSENNSDDVLAREEFVLSIAIKFTPFSKFVKIFFTTSAQGSNVEDDV